MGYSAEEINNRRKVNIYDEIQRYPDIEKINK